MSRRLTTNEFILKANDIHGYIYDYIYSIYINSHIDVDIICKIHGLFKQRPNNHLNGQGCPKCGKQNITSDTIIFTHKANIIHQNIYDYSKVIYKNSKVKIIIGCDIHGYFEQLPNSHLNGNGCSECATNAKLTISQFINRSNVVHNNFYGYYDDFKNVSKKVYINCPIHGDFIQKPSNHLNGNRCPKCGRKNTQEYFIKRSNIVHNNFYIYDKVIYKSARSIIIITCPIHGDFNQKAGNHVNSKHGCPKCGQQSKGEDNIKEFLERNEIKYITQKTFKECKYKNTLKFDFYIGKLNLCIEFDGIQHYKIISFFGGEKEFKNRIIRDNIKTNFCENNNIELIRIPYYKIDNISEILNEKIINMK